jgi:hypothetical protein
MKTTARQCASGCEAVVDVTGFDGFAVAGAYFTGALQLRYPEMKVTLRKKSKPMIYRFGGGTALASQYASAQLMIGKEEISMHWDVVPGSIPLLLGRDFGVQFKLLIDVESGEVWSKRSGEWQLIARNSRQGLLYLSLRGGIESKSYKQLRAALTTLVDEKRGAISETTTDVESVRDADCGEPGTPIEVNQGIPDTTSIAMVSEDAEERGGNDKIKSERSEHAADTGDQVVNRDGGMANIMFDIANIDKDQIKEKEVHVDADVKSDQGPSKDSRSARKVAKNAKSVAAKGTSSGKIPTKEWLSLPRVFEG